MLDGVLDPERVIQIGIRGGGEYLWEFSFDSGMTVIHAEEVDELGVEAVVDRGARGASATGRSTVSFDVDSLDPALRARHRHARGRRADAARGAGILRGLRRPPIDRRRCGRGRAAIRRHHVTAQIGAQMLFELLRLMALTPGAKS